MRASIILFLKGIAMGAANVIPGVSGGTVAFITGIYERLITALKNIDVEALRLLCTGHLSKFLRQIDFNFLFFLFLGVFASILSLARLLALALELYEVLTLSFFFGLIISSIYVVSKRLDEINFYTVISFLVGAGVAVTMAFLPPAQPNDSFIYLMVCGIIAICSMILPGLSGSYILLLMGNYVLVLKAINGFDLEVISPIVLGCIIGLIVFSRLLSYLFKYFKNITISILAGFVAGSLAIIWPWKQAIKETFIGKEKVVGYVWQLPSMGLQFVMAVFLILLGIFIILWMEKESSES